MKRETGEKPVRTRHCKRGVPAKKATVKTGRQTGATIREPGDLLIRSPPARYPDMEQKTANTGCAIQGTALFLFETLFGPERKERV